jgi:hypothetical protein
MSALSGVVEGDRVGLSGAPAFRFDDKNVGSAKSVTQSGLALSGSDARNYILTTAPGSADITPALLSANISANNKTYDGTTSATATVGPLVGVASGDSVQLADSESYSFTDKNVGTGKVVNAAGLRLVGSDAGNYQLLANLSGTADITPALLTYVSALPSRDSGSSNPVFTGTVTGFVNGETIGNATTGTLVFSSPATADSAPGKYPVNGSGLVAINGNYVFTQDPGNASALTITVPVPAVQLGGASQGNGSTDVIVVDNSPQTLPTQVLYKPQVSTMVMAEIANALGTFQFSFSHSSLWAASTTAGDGGSAPLPLAESSFFSRDNQEDAGTQYPGAPRPQ